MSRIEFSSVATANKRPSGENSRAVPALGMDREYTSRLVGRCHSLSDSVRHMEARVWSSGEKTRLVVSCMCPGKSASNHPVATSQSRIVPSILPVAMVAPSWENATPLT